MTSETASSESRNTFELAALRLLLCAQAAGAHHQTPMTRAQAASTRGRRAVQECGSPFASTKCIASVSATLRNTVSPTRNRAR
jgi:hypothetical protein